MLRLPSEFRASEPCESTAFGDSDISSSLDRAAGV